MIKKLFSLIAVLAVMIGVFSATAGAYCVPVRVRGVTAVSCPEEREVTVSWNPVRYADSYQVQISRSASDWSKSDEYTLNSKYTTRYASFNPYSEHRAVDYDDTDIYYARVRAVIKGRCTAWSRVVKTELVEREQEGIKVEWHGTVPDVRSWFAVKGLDLP